MQKAERRLIRSLLPLLVIVPVAALALESDSEQPIRIQADAAMVDENKGSSVYRGNVIITQGTLRVTADEVEILTANSEVMEIIAVAVDDSSTLAHYEQQLNENRDMVSAQASKITYLVREERLHLAGNAHLKQVNDEFTGELLHYDMARGIVNLNSSSGEGRVNMTINPKKSR